MKSSFIFICLLLSFLCRAQQPQQNYTRLSQQFSEAVKLYSSGKKDSALKYFLLIRTTAKDNNYNDIEAQTCNQLAEHYFQHGEYSQSRIYNTQLLIVARVLTDKTLLLEANSREGSLLLEEGKLQEAEIKLMEALALSEAAEKNNGEVLSTIASVFLARGEKEKALSWFLKALTAFESTNNEKRIAEIYSNISSVYYLSGDVDAAINMAEQSIGIRRKIKDDQGLVISALNIGQLYLLKNNNQTGYQYLKEAVTISEKTDNKKLKASALVALSVYYMRNKMNTEAYPLQQKAISLFEQLNDKTQLSRMYVAFGGLCNAVKDSVTAAAYYLKGLQTSIEINNKENIGNAYDKLSTFYLLHEDYKKAYDYYKNYIGVRDSILQKSNLAKINEYKIKYETEKKDNEIGRLSTLAKLKQLEIERQAALLKSNISEAKRKQIEITLLAQSKQLQAVKLTEQENMLQQKDLAVKNEQQKLELTYNQLKVLHQQAEINTRDAVLQKFWRNAIAVTALLSLLLIGILFNRYKLKRELIKKQELLDIRNNISKDLHDEIGSTLTSIHILSRTSVKVNEQQPEKAKEMLQKIATQAQSIQQNMSDIVWSLRNENEEINSLFIRIREYITQTAEPLGISINFSIATDVKNIKLPITYRKELLLICKEAINNTVKHAGATSISISIYKVSANLIMEIADNGTWKGATSGTGQKSMNERAQSLGGGVQVTGNNEGTKVVASLPIP